MNILHLSDIHVGLADQGWLWPSIKKAFFEDLARQAPRNGPWDVVVFTGDLTQAGLPAEYERLTSLLRELWDHFRGLGCNPFFLAVPGNHDLSRPDSQRAVVKVLKNFADDAEAQSTFWTNEANEYRIVITDAFKNYVEWWSRLSGLGIPIPYISYGILPGDFSAYVEVNGERTGFVGLNSAWLQLTNDRYKGRLHVDPRQIMGVTEGYPDEWLCQNEFNLLLTHHPVEWFSPACQLLWRSEIYIPDRFDCHLYGHMHEQLAVVSATWGSGGRRLIQAPSIFGLDKLGDGTTARCHGYSVLQTTKTEERKVIRLWPRIARPIQSGERRIVANVELGLENDSWTEISYQNQPKNGSSPPSTLAPQIQTLPSGDSLTQFRMSLRHVARTSAVRVVERDRALTALRGEGIFWLVSDWGMGGDEFLSSIGSELGIDLANVFALDLHPYRTFDEILSGVQEQAGCSFEMLCEAISVQPASLVILDDVAVGEPYETSSHPFESELERLARVMRQYCDNAMVVIRSRQRPSGCSLLEVELKPFDLADTAAYIRASELGGDQSSARGIAERFHDHTDGVPSRLDLALKHVKALGLSALHSTNTDVAGKSAVRKGQYKELELAIADLTNSENPSMKRAFLLLQALSMFPRGEVLETVKRFDSVVVFYEQDALLLIERGFVDTVDMSGVRAADFMEHSRLLVVRRSVRDAIYESSTSEDLARLNSRALTSYFGGEWGAGRIKSRRGLHLDESGCADWQIGNANMLVLRAPNKRSMPLMAQRCDERLCLPMYMAALS